MPANRDKTPVSGTVRSRTYNEPKLGHEWAAESGREALEEIGREQLELLGPDARFARHGDYAVAFRDGRRGIGETLAGDPFPRGLDAREEGVGSDVASDVFQGGGEGAGGEASHGASCGSGERQH